MTKRIKTPFFQNDTVPLRFKVQSKSGDIDVISARVSVFSGQKEVIHDAPCDIENNIVFYLVPSSATEAYGNYRADFTVHIEPDITRTHIMRFHIAQKSPPLPSRVKDITIMPLDIGSTEYEASGAIASATRLLRRAGIEVKEAARITRDLAEKMTGRRI